MSTTYNIEIREFNGIDYDILYPITTIENVNGLTTSLNDLDTRKVNVSDLGTLAGKNSILLTSDVSGVLPVSNGGTGSATVNAHEVFVGTSGTGTSAPSFRGLEASDIPSLNASKITSGTFGVARGGTGITSNPSMRVNLTSTSAANVFAASPQPGVTGTLPVTNGGTGITSNPSMKVNLGSTSAANVFAASPQPGVTGTLPVANGGTGANNAGSARTNLGITAIAVRPDYQVSTTDLGENQPLTAGKIYFYVGS